MLELFGLAGDAPPPVDGELLGMCHPDDRPLVSDQLSLVASGNRVHVAYRIIRPDRETRWIEAFGTGVFNDAGVRTRSPRTLMLNSRSLRRALHIPQSPRGSGHALAFG